jgi:predicted GH43/DUF377 family glycosyl hydrolase
VTVGQLAVRRDCHLRPDPSRVIARLFVPGHYLSGGPEGQASGVVEHVLALDDAAVSETLAEIVTRFGSRHRDLAGAFRHHAGRIGNRLGPEVELSEERWMLLGATFTTEYAVEAAALCNPSVVALPDQTGAPPGGIRFVMSVRQIGEGHRSSIGFRVGALDGDGEVTVDDCGPFTTAATIEAGTLDADAFRGLAERLDDGTEATTWVLDRLGAHFTVGELDQRLAQLEAQRDTRRNVAETVRRIRALAARTYTARFPPSASLGERVLYPATGIESNGVEDARFVRFVDDDGSVTYLATYTAFDGDAIAQQLLTTTDFSTFAVSPLLGAAAANKGMALFPRRIAGRFAALSRHDGATNGVAFSDDVRQWPTAAPLECPVATWEAVQVGNCGPPIETDEGWLVLTHGVGPMRTYSIGAWLLDLDAPTRVIGRLHRPLLTPLPEEQDGYVPNVVYSCGALLHEGTLMVPFGIADAAVGFATVALDDLLGSMGPPGTGEALRR